MRLSRNHKKPVPARSRRRRVAVLLPVAALWLLPAAAAPASQTARDAETVTRARFLMGTTLSIETTTPHADRIEDAFAEVARLEGVMSNWKADSEIARLNREAAERTFVCTADLFRALSAALGWARATSGAFDPTVEPLVRRLGLRGPEGRLPGDADEGRVDSGSTILEPPAMVGWRHVVLDRADRGVRFDAPGVGLDLGGIGKGIALDAAAAVLRRGGVTTALLDFGGQLLAFGSAPGGRGFRVGIADPADRSLPALTLWLRDLSLATSGNGERSVQTPQGTVGHILDPRAGTPAPFTGTVTALAATATDADALSTALFVMGPERGLAWADRHGIAAIYQWLGGEGRLIRWETRLFRVLTRDEPHRDGDRGGDRGADEAEPARGSNGGRR
jgi:FAD:protein FMN transferase